MAVITPDRAALFIPDNLKKFKWKLFERIGAHIKKAGGLVVYHEAEKLLDLPQEIVPIVGCHPMCRPFIDRWTATGRPFVYWDRGYARRIFATWLPRGEDGGFYRWHFNSFQMQQIHEVPKDRWMQLKTPTAEWSKGGGHIVIAAPTETYSAFHGTWTWTEDTVARLKHLTDRPLRIREKLSKTPLAMDLQGAHALVSHQSNAAVEAVILGCPVFVDPGSAAALVGHTDLAQIETPIRPERKPWLWSLAYSQFNEKELVDGTLWRLMR